MISITGRERRVRKYALKLCAIDRDDHHHHHDLEHSKDDDEVTKHNVG